MSEENGPPPLWWSPTGGLIRGYGNAGYDDAVPLGVIEDPKRRGPSYQRGRADGRLEAVASTADLDPILRARTGWAEPSALLDGIASDTVDDVDRERLETLARAIRGAGGNDTTEEDQHG